jgi:hypothetical protein
MVWLKMLAKSDRDISEVVDTLAAFNLEAGYLVLTKTGLEKSICDAHESFRSFLKSKGIHDFSKQKLGPGNKKIVPIYLILKDELVALNMSLYRPKTKKGDPRVWVRGLKPYIKAGNLLAFFKVGQEIYILNTSDRNLWKTLKTPESNLNNVLRSSLISLGAVEVELLELLKAVEQKGWVETVSKSASSTNDVGDTLETLLGIRRNSSKAPDYKGIEIKGSHKGPATKKLSGKFDLFGLVPNWAISPVKSEVQLVNEFGYDSKKHGAKALQSTVKHTKNPQGLYLDYDEEQDWIQNNKSLGNKRSVNIVNWKLSDLKSSLSAKHNKTFWVVADKRVNPKTSIKEFHYHTVIASSEPLLNNFALLILQDTVSLEYVAKQEINLKGKTIQTSRGPGKGFPKIRSHGVNWKIKSSRLSSLFPNNRTIDLKSYVP